MWRNFKRIFINWPILLPLNNVEKMFIFTVWNSSFRVSFSLKRNKHLIRIFRQLAQISLCCYDESWTHQTDVFHFFILFALELRSWLNRPRTDEPINCRESPSNLTGYSSRLSHTAKWCQYTYGHTHITFANSCVFKSYWILNCLRSRRSLTLSFKQVSLTLVSHKLKPDMKKILHSSQILARLSNSTLALHVCWPKVFDFF